MSRQVNSNKIIAAALNLQEHNVKGRLKNIPSKLEADDRMHAAMIAIKRGFIDG